MPLLRSALSSHRLDDLFEKSILELDFFPGLLCGFSTDLFRVLNPERFKLRIGQARIAPRLGGYRGRKSRRKRKSKRKRRADLLHCAPICAIYSALRGFAP